MVRSEEIIERTFYVSLLKTMLRMGVTINPDDYLPLSEENQKRFEADKSALPKFTYLFGIGNNQVRGAKICPRITLELNGYFPGDLGLNANEIEEGEDGNFQVVEYPWETKDITIDVHLVANTQQDMRMLHNILYSSLPARGYIVPYLDNDFEAWKQKKVGPDGNLFIEVNNYYDHPELDHGMLEKVYTYLVKDGIIYPETINEDFEIVPIKDISVLIQSEESREDNSVTLHVPD